mgnify:CR=1 FL=1
MMKDLHRKLGPIILSKDLIQVVFSFFISAIIGVIYSFMIIDETIGGYINRVLPSKAGPDLHQYLPVVITVLIYSFFIQKKNRNVLEKISFTCLQNIIAIVSCICSLILLLLIQQHFMRAAG